MKTAWILVLLVGCQSARGLSPPAPDAAPPSQPKTPPPASGGGNTADGCGGVTERGECRLTGDREKAVACDVAAHQLRTIDCTAIGKHCVVDVQRGATCESLIPPGASPDAGAPRPDAGAPRPDAGAPLPDAGSPSPTPPNPVDAGASMPMCPSGIDFRGYCWGDVAVWCDPTTGTTYLWNCPLDGKQCGEDTCATGAYCCGAAAPPPDASAPSECDQLGFAGECSGNTARWCSGGQVIDLDCTARNQVCGVDTCASGAYCCDPPADPTADECARLGLAGECQGNTAVWCQDGQIQQLDCGATGTQCQVDRCAQGAYCCSN